MSREKIYSYEQVVDLFQTRKIDKYFKSYIIETQRQLYDLICKDGLLVNTTFNNFRHILDYYNRKKFIIVKIANRWSRLDVELDNKKEKLESHAELMDDLINEKVQNKLSELNYKLNESISYVHSVRSEFENSLRDAVKRIEYLENIIEKYETFLINLKTLTAVDK